VSHRLTRVSNVPHNTLSGASVPLFEIGEKLVPVPVEQEPQPVAVQRVAGVPAPPARVRLGELPPGVDAYEALVGRFLLRFGQNTRDAYGRDLSEWAAFCAGLGVHPLAAGLDHGDAFVRVLAEGRWLSPASVARRLAACASFYRYVVQARLLPESPFAGVCRPKITDESTTVALTRDEAAALRLTAAGDGARSHALVALLLHNGLRISEVLSRDIGHLGWERGHRTLRLERKGGRVQTAPLTPATAEVLDAYIGERSEGPIFVTATGARWTRRHAGRVMRRLAHEAGLPSAAQVTLHSARHTFATAALDAGVALRDVQAAMGHADPRTTMRYDRSRESLDRHATYAVTAYFA
jgi:integrase/recombinase XerD